MNMFNVCRKVYVVESNESEWQKLENFGVKRNLKFGQRNKAVNFWFRQIRVIPLCSSQLLKLANLKKNACDLINL